jgi:hypothetical protein
LLSASDTLAAKLEHEFCNDNDCPVIVIVLLVLITLAAAVVVVVVECNGYLQDPLVSL